MLPDKLSKMYEGTSKYEQHKRTFYHLWGMYKKSRKVWTQTHKLMQKVLKLNIELKTKFSFGMRDKGKKVMEVCSYI